MKAGVSIGPCAVWIDAGARRPVAGLDLERAAAPASRPHRRLTLEQRAAGHRRRLGDAEQLEGGRGDVGEDAAGAQRPRPSAVTISGTGLSEWAVLGEPSGSSMWSQLPWSAVTMQAPPLRRDRGDDVAEAGVDRLDRRDRGRDDAGVADHVGVGEVDDPEAVGAAAPALDEGLGGGGGAHLRLVVVGGDVAGRVDQAALLALPLLPRGRR